MRKVSRKQEQNETITIPEDVTIDLGDREVILEAGDKIRVIEVKSKATFGHGDGFTWAYSVDGVERDLHTMPFGRALDGMRKLKSFADSAKVSWVDAKHKPTLSAVKAWVKDNNPSQFYAKWKSDSSTYKDDSIEIYYL